jgi:hypothetical protein
MTAFWFSLFWGVWLGVIIGIPLYRISDSLEASNRWQMEQWQILAAIRDTLRDIKRSS